MNLSEIFAKDNINKGRQVELDIAKAISIVFMILTHVEIIAVLFSNTISYDYHYIVTLVSGGVFSAPVFMFCMGVGLVYSRNTQWNFLIKRGFNLFIMAIFVNVCEFIIPHFLSEILLGNSQKFPIFGGLILFYCDILFFASLSFILIGILKKLNISIKMMFVFALIMSIIGTIFRFADFNAVSLNVFFGLIIGTIKELSAFPLLNWFIIPIGGYLWGEYFIRVKDKKKFYKFWSIFIILAILYFYLTSHILGTGMFSEDEGYYYYMTTIDAIFCIILSHGLCGLYYHLSKYLPNNIIKEFSYLSKNITKIYIFQWFFIPILIILFVFFFKNINISDLICFIMGIAVLLISGTCNRIIDKTTTICSH